MATKAISGATQAPDGSVYMTMTDGAGNIVGPGLGTSPSGAASTAASSGNVAAGVAAATLPAVATKTNYLSGFSINGSGATLGSVVNATVTGLVGGTWTIPVTVVAGVLLGNTPIIYNFNPQIPASAVNTAITVSCPSLGTGSTNSAVNIWGYNV